MTKSLSNIRKELTIVESQTKELFQHFYQSYHRYIYYVDIALQQQLTLAVHQVCTKLHPNEFLSLSLTSRGCFQSRLRQLSSQFQSKFISSLYGSSIHWNEEQPSLSLPETAARETNHETSLTCEHSSDMISLAEDTFSVTEPEELRQWCRQVEQSIHLVLDELSRETNQLLQESHIVSNHLPPEILEMAMQSDAQGMGISRDHNPHILSVLIETNPLAEAEESLSSQEEDENKELSPLTKLIAIHLRLMDLEFTDPNLSLIRKQLRQLSERLKKLYYHHHSLQKELRVAEAERAWQASWSLSATDETG